MEKNQHKGRLPAEIYKVLKYISEFLLQCLIFYLAINYAYIKQYREQHIIVNQGIDDFLYTRLLLESQQF